MVRRSASPAHERTWAPARVLHDEVQDRRAQRGARGRAEGRASVLAACGEPERSEARMTVTLILVVGLVMAVLWGALRAESRGA